MGVPSVWTWLLLALTAARLFAAARLPLAADEAYYWVWSRALAPGYLDHPPMVALWIRAGTAIAGQNPLGIRLLGPIAAALGTWLLAGAADDWAPTEPVATRPGPPPGIVAGVLLNATLLTNVGAVVMTPDTPLLFFWTATMAALARALRTGQASWLLAAGAAFGLALDSKYTALLGGGGVGLWLVATSSGRLWLRKWQLYAAGGLAFLMVAPVLAWNAGHGWASVIKQGARAGDWHPSQAWRFEVELIAGQIGLATPLVFAAMAYGYWRLARPPPRPHPASDLAAAPSRGLLLCTALVPLAVFLQHAVGGRVQANWPGIIYPGAAMAAALARAPAWRTTAASGLLLSLAIYIQALAGPWTLPGRFDVIARRLAGWSDIADDAASVGRQCGGTFIAADEYGLAAELAWQLPQVLGVEPRWKLFRLPSVPLAGRTGILLRSTRRTAPLDPTLWQHVTIAATVARPRAGTAVEHYTLACVTGRAGAAGVVLPSRS